MRTIPLTLNQHLICLGIGLFSLINGVITKAILNPQWFAWIRIKEDATQEEVEKSVSKLIRQPSRLVKSMRKENISSAAKKVNMTHNTELNEPLVYTAISNKVNTSINN